VLIGWLLRVVGVEHLATAARVGLVVLGQELGLR
jgi:hypothetical protein